MATTAPRGSIELWFDFSCPYAYLAFHRAADLATRVGLELHYKPMLLGGVFRGIAVPALPSGRAAGAGHARTVDAGDGPMATLSATRAAYNARDMARWAEKFATPLTMPAAHPMRTVLALRVLLGLPETTWSAAIAAIYAAYWQRGDDVTSPAVLARVLTGAGIDAAAVDAAIAGADRDEIKAELRARTDQAIALGVFGAPAWVIRRDGGHWLVWGQDRLPFVEAIARGWDADHAPAPARAPAPRTTATAPLELYLDVASPFAYLALMQLPTLLAATGAEVRLRPILLGGLFRAIGTPEVPIFQFPTAKRTYTFADMGRWARWLGAPFAFPSRFPQRTIAAQRLLTAALAHPISDQLRLATALARAMWAEQRDLEDEATLAQIVAACELPAELLAQTRDPAVKQQLMDTTHAAATAGVFGVPTYGVAGHLTWGQDRVELVADMLAGWRPANG